MAAELAIIAKLQDEASGGIRALRGEIEGLEPSSGVAARGFQSLQSVGAVSLAAVAGAAVATAAATGLFVKSAIQAGIEFESAFAGVIKTVDGVVDAGGDLTAFGEALRESFRQLALEIPVSVNELAKIGELGGQLGVAGDDLIEFTRLIAQLGVTTNLSGEQAAMAFAQFGNIMGSTQDELTRFGSAVVWLGNNFATTEADIVEFATRIAGAGAIAGMTEADLAGIGAAFTSVGVQAEAGGTAVQKVLLDMNTAVVTGGSQLEKYAQAAGMSAEQFAAAWRNDPGQAFTRFVEGLGTAGDEAILILDDLGLADARLARAFLSVANAGDLLGDAIEGSNQAFIDNMALAREAALRFGTVESQMQLFRNVVNDVKIALYDALRPAIVAILSALTTFISTVAPQVRQWFEAIGVAVGQFVAAVLQGEAPIGALVDAVFRLAEELGVPAERLGEIREQLDGFMTAVGAVVGPIVEAVNSFVSWKDVLVALAIAIGSIVIPAVISIISAIAPVVAVFAGLVLAIAAVRNAFETNFLGIRDLAMDLWSALQGVFEGIRALLSGDTDAAMAAFRSAWEAGWNAIVGFIQNAGAQIGTAIQGLWQSIVTWFQSVDWGALGQSLVEKFLAGMAALGQARADLWAWVLTSLTNFIQSVDWGQLGYTLMDLLVKGIVGAVGLIGVALAGIVTFIWNFITGTNWIELGVNLVSAIVEGLSSFAQGAAAALDDWRQVIFDWAGAEDWSGVAQVIIDMVSEALGDAADAIAGQLTSWRDAIFDWAGAEDWSGVATTIVEMVATSLSEAADTLAQSASTWYDAISNWAQSVDWAGIGSTIVSLVLEGLETLVDNVSSTVSSWWDAIVRFVGGIDWSEIGITIVNLVLEGLTELVDNASDAVSSWWDAFTNAVDSIDWYQIGYDIAFWIVDGTLEITTMIQEKISGWYTQFRQVTEGMTWDQIGILIVLAIVGGLIKFAERVYTVVQDWYNRISGAVSSFAGSFLTLGSNIVGGIISGIQSMAGAIADAIRGIIAGALGAGEEAAGAHSPATKFMPLGNDISAGVAVGIAQGAGAVISAIQQVANAAQVEGAKAFGEAMKAIAEGIAAALSAAMDIGSFTGAGDGFGAALESITALMKQMVDAVAGANSYGAEALAELSDFVGLAADINDLLAQTADVTDYIARWRPPSVADTTAAIQTLIGYLSMMVDGITGMNLETMLILGVLDDFLKSALQLPKLFVGVADIMSFLASWHAPSLGPVIGAINTLAGFLQAMVSAVAGANTMGLGMLAILGAFIETASGIVELIAPLAEAIKNIATFPSGGALGFVVENVKEMAIYLKAMVAAVAESNEWGALSLALLEQFVQVAGGIVELIAPLAEAIKNAASFPGGGHLNFVVANIEEMATYLQAMVSAIAKSNEWGELSLALLDEFVQVAGEIANLIAPMMEAIKNIASFRAPDWSSFISGVASIGTYMALLVGSFNEGLRYSHEALGLLDEYVAVVVTLAESTEEFIKAIELAASFRAPDWSSFISGVASIGTYMALLVGSFNEGLRYSHEALSLIGEYVDVAADIVDLVGDAIEALGLIAGYSSNTAALKPAIDSFGADLVLLVETLGAAFAAATRETTDAVASAAAFAEDAKDIVDVVEPGIDVLTALATYVSSSGVAASVQAFAADLVMVVTALGAAFAAASAEMGTAAGQAATFAEDAKDIVDVVEPGIEALTALATYVSSSGVAASVQAFAADLVMVITALADGLAASGLAANQAVTEAAALSGNLTEILDVVEPGIEALTALAEYTSGVDLQAKTQQFTSDLIAVTQLLVAGITQSALAAGSALDQATAMAQSINQLLEVVKPALEALAGLAEYSSAADVRTKAAQFTADLVAVASLLVTGLNSAAAQLGQDTISAAHAFATAVTGVVVVVSEAVNGLSQLAQIPMPDVGPRLDYLVASAQQIAGATQQAGVVAQAVEQMAVFRDNVQQLVDEVLGALAELGRLAAGDAPGSVQQVLSMMLAAFQNQAGAFAGAGSMLADNVTTGWRAADWTGSGLYAVVQIAAGAMGAMAAVTKAGDAVGDEFIAAVVGAVNGGQGQVVAAVVQVVNAAIDAGRSAAKGAAAIGQDLATFAANAAASERSAMDAAGSAVGNALIDGMARAITAGKSRLVNAIKDAVNSAVAAAKAALGIASPSRVAYELIDNFMRTAAGRFGDAGDMVAAIGRSMDATVAEGAARLARARLQPAFDTSASMARSPVLPTVMPRPATAGASTEFAGRGGAINIYGNIVLPNVSNPVSFLEELDALRGGG